MAALATITDVENRWRPLTDEETVVASTRLDDASELVRTLIPGIDDAITAGTVSESLVAAQVAAMVIRVLRNPNGVRQESIGDYSYTLADDDRMFMTADELESLSPSTATRAFTIRPSYTAPDA